jgi:hypothetical protein
MNARFNPQDPTGSSLVVDSTISSGFKSPFNFPLDITAVQTNLNFADPSTNKPFANLKSDFAPAKSDQNAGSLSTTMNGGTLSEIPGNDGAFSKFFKDLTSGNAVTASIQGTVSVKANTASGAVTISNIPVTDSLSLQGLGGFNHFDLKNMTITSGTSQGLSQSISLQMNNPSNMSLNLGTDINFDLSYNGVNVGTTSIKNLVLNPGPNAITAFANINPVGDQAMNATRSLIASFVGGKEVPLVCCIFHFQIF